MMTSKGESCDSLCGLQLSQVRGYHFRFGWSRSVHPVVGQTPFDCCLDQAAPHHITSTHVHSNTTLAADAIASAAMSIIVQMTKSRIYSQMTKCLNPFVDRIIQILFRHQ